MSTNALDPAIERNRLEKGLVFFRRRRDEAKAYLNASPPGPVARAAQLRLCIADWAVAIAESRLARAAKRTT
jgi:hypothetical protein